MGSKEFEQTVTKQLLSYCQYNRYIQGKFWDRTIKANMQNVTVKLHNNFYVSVENCQFDIYWKEGIFEFRCQPKLAGYGKLVQRNDKLFIEEIHFDKITILNQNSSNFRRFTNEKIQIIVNKFIQNESFAIYQDNRLAKVKIRIDSSGIYAKLK